MTLTTRPFRSTTLVTAAIVIGFATVTACGSEPAEVGDASTPSVVSGPAPAPPVSDPNTSTTDPPTTDPATTDNAERSPGEPGPDEDPPIVTAGFGSNMYASPCWTVVLTNDADDLERLQQGVDCFFESAGHSERTVWDVLVPTPEGDPILYRYDRSADGVTIVVDNRLDSFGTPTVSAQRCTTVERSDFLPVGIDCETFDHPGFPEADSRDPVDVREVSTDVSYYGACGNEIVEVGGTTYFPIPDGQGAALAVTHRPSSEPRGLVRVVEPGPGDDVGTFVVFEDGVARFESDSGRVVWLSDEELVYWFVC